MNEESFCEEDEDGDEDPFFLLPLLFPFFFFCKTFSYSVSMASEILSAFYWIYSAPLDAELNFFSFLFLLVTSVCFYFNSTREFYLTILQR